MPKKTTAAQRKAFIEEQRAKPQGYGAKAVFPRDMSFINKSGDIVRPTKENPWPEYSKGRGYNGKPSERKRHYDSTRAYETGHTSTSNRYHKHHNLAQEFSAVVGIVGILGGLFFLSSNITGNAIAGMNVSNSSMIGAGLLIVGLIAGYFFIKNK